MNKDTQKEIDETINNLKMILKPLTDYDNVHYYDIKQKTLNPDMNLYL